MGEYVSCHVHECIRSPCQAAMCVRMLDAQIRGGACDT